jgi:hypothetical protein
VVMCTRVTSSYLWVDTGLVDMLRPSATSSSFLISLLVSFSPPSSPYTFLGTRPKILKTRLTNQKVRIVMAFETGQDYTETSSGYAQDKPNLTEGGILCVLYDSTVLIILSL